MLKHMLLLLATSLALTSCATSNGSSHGDPQSLSKARLSSFSAAEETQRASIRATLAQLYEAFCFDAGGQADWDSMTSLFLPGASFVAPVRPGQATQAVDTNTFIADFKRYVNSPAASKAGLHERILHQRIDLLGHIAHAYVSFEGFVPNSNSGADSAKPPKAVSVGLDSIQLIRDNNTWKVVSFTTQYASANENLPSRFLATR